LNSTCAELDEVRLSIGDIEGAIAGLESDPADQIAIRDAALLTIEQLNAELQNKQNELKIQ